ncbi:MAG TPA: class I SAM-dependent methyltransferase [Amycolatopsis sp.]|nr:class I SAM-dependent methyltransferase [Amycolatopsis sp.]
MTLDPEKLDQAVGKVFAELGVNATAPLLVLGDRLGLWRALAGAGPLTFGELAARTGLMPRYVREWVRAVAVAGYLDYDRVLDTFTLTDEMAAVVADDSSPTAMIGILPGLPAFWGALDQVERFFRTGGGMGWGDHDPVLNLAQERFTRPQYVHGLVGAWIPAVAGILPKLERGARIADVGCGYGLSTILIGQTWPNCTVTGFDLDDSSIAHARKAAADAGLTGRVTFEVAAADQLPGHGYDLVTFTDSLHDMGDPVAAVARSRRALAGDGTILVIEPLAADQFADDFANPYARIGYAVSTLVCTPSSLSQPGAAGLGAMAGEAKLREVLAAGGLREVHRIAREAAPFNIILEARP